MNGTDALYLVVVDSLSFGRNSMGFYKIMALWSITRENVHRRRMASIGRAWVRDFLRACQNRTFQSIDKGVYNHE